MEWRDLDSDLRRELEGLEAEHRRRRLRVLRREQGTSWAEVDGRRALVACGNDYLGLAQDPRVVEAAVEAARTLGVGSTGSPLISGFTEAHERLRDTVSDLRAGQAVTLFPSGYQANLGVLGALLSRRDLVLADRLVHASALDGCRLSGATLRRFRHNDPDHLERLLGSAPSEGRILVLVEGLYSMDGDLCALPPILEVTRRHGALLMVDDAHGCGVLGAHGRGVDEHFGLLGEADVYLGTFGKAFGAAGAFVSSSQPVADMLVNRARSLIYSTASPVPVAAAAARAVELAQEEPERRTRLGERARALRAELDRAGALFGGDLQIVPLPCGRDDIALELAGELLEAGVFAQAIRPPTVPEGSARLRVTLSAGYSDDDFAHLTRTLVAALAPAMGRRE